MISQIFYLTPDKIVIALVVLFIYYLDYRPPWWNRSKKTQQSVPGPAALPILGTTWMFYLGFYKLHDIKEFYYAMYKKYGPIFKQETYFNFPIYNIFEKKDIEKVLKIPSKYPVRPPSEAAILYRLSRPDRYASAGITNAQGETWHLLRATLTPSLTSPKTMSNFMPEVHSLAEDWVSYLKRIQGPNGAINDLSDAVVPLCFETTLDLVLGRRLGYLSPNPLSEKSRKLVEALEGHFISLRDTQFNFPWWKFFPTKAFRMLGYWENYIYETVLEMVAEYGDENGDDTVYNSILRANIDEREKTGAIIDFISAGIHTLKNSLVFLLHMVAEHPEKQERIAMDLNYAKACMNEAFRLLPTATPLSRITEQDMELGGYQVKAGSVILCHGDIASRSEQNFERPNEFLPERWLGEERSKSVTSGIFIVIPFGAGKRICPGKRFIELVLPIFLQETVKHYSLTTSQKMEIEFQFLTAPKGPVSINVNDRD
ncbi:ecdysone 20-monooxygenase [Coccinella septempunctata]|uniref:ecdysone 20-monooxygenase n=1 Tax=Coccinella septempunctata TaxID=41139 RepID=UPI001D05C8DA|nr:ecdysone 20-monooxygenase [Coccinella septempunctata]XP_044761458.1 ecdysone 20-monooxygenase [Coccinella septempunctata]